MKTRLIGIVGIALSTLVLIGSASADAIFSPANSGSGVNNITIDIPQSVGPNGVPPNPNPMWLGYPYIVGHVASEAKSIDIAFSSTMNNLIRTSSNSIQSGTLPNIPLPGHIHDISILPCWSFSTTSTCYSFKEIHFDTPHKATVDDIRITAFVCTPQADLALPCLDPKTVTQLEPSKSDAWTITAIDNEVIWKVAFASPTGFDALDTIRFSKTGAVHLEGGVVPEPSSMLLLGSGVLGLAGVLRRKLI